jgi:hypothetical protein
MNLHRMADPTTPLPPSFLDWLSPVLDNPLPPSPTLTLGAARGRRVVQAREKMLVKEEGG